MNESTASIARNTKAMMGSQVITWVSSFVLMSFLPRYLGAEGYGKLFFALSINAIAGLLTDLGLTMLLVKEIARDRSKVSSLVVNGWALRSIAWTISTIITVLFVTFSSYPTETIHIVLVLALANWFVGMSAIIHGVFNGLERLEYRSICLIAEKVTLSIVGVALLLLGMGPFAIALVMLFTFILNFTLSVVFLRRITSIHFELTPSTWKPLLRQGFPFMVSTLFALIYYRIDVMMLSSMTNDAVVGWYGAPYRLFDTLMFFPVILTTAVYPVLARLWQTSKESMIETSRKIFDLTIIVAVPIAVGMASLAQPIISFLFGLEEYWNSIVLLQILSVSILLVYIDFVLNTVLISHDKQKQLSIVAVFATVLNIGMNYFAIQFFQTNFGNGAIGAAITTALTEIFVMSLSVYLLPKGTFTSANMTVALKSIFSGALMWATVWAVQVRIPHGPGWIVAAVAGFAVYFLMLFMLKVVSKREFRFFLHMLPLRKQVVGTNE